jgi:hypothetical protein
MGITRLRTHAPITAGLTGSVTLFSFRGNTGYFRPASLSLGRWHFGQIASRIPFRTVFASSGLHFGSIPRPVLRCRCHCPSCLHANNFPSPLTPPDLGCHVSGPPVFPSNRTSPEERQETTPQYARGATRAAEMIDRAMVTRNQ